MSASKEVQLQSTARFFVLGSGDCEGTIVLVDATNCKVCASANNTCENWSSTAGVSVVCPPTNLLWATRNAAWGSSWEIVLVGPSNPFSSNVPSGKLVPISWALWKQRLQWRKVVATSAAVELDLRTVKSSKRRPFSPGPPGWKVIRKRHTSDVEFMSLFDMRILRIASDTALSKSPTPRCSVLAWMGLWSSSGKHGWIVTRWTGLLTRHCS